MKKIYNNPIIEIIRLKPEDIITTSNELQAFDAEGNPVDEFGNIV